MATAGLDFVFIDTEHISLTVSQVAGMCQAYRGLSIPALVRIPTAEPVAAAQMIDIGASGIIAPYVESPEVARELVGAVKYRPLKGQRLRQKLAGEALEPALDAYLEQRNASNVLVLNIESVPALHALDQILDVTGIDAILIGPHDLSCSLGIPEQYGHVDFLDACRRIFVTARKHGVGAGIHFMGGVAEQIQFLELGAHMLVHSADLVLATKHLREDLAAIRKAVGDHQKGEGEIDAI